MAHVESIPPRRSVALAETTRPFEYVSETCNCRASLKYIRSSKRAEELTIEYTIDAEEPNEQFAVHCRGVTKTCRTGDAGVMALRGVDLDVRRDELLMLVGPSGCGKTSLISVIAAILDPDPGNCEVLGQNLKAMDPKERTRFRGVSIGFVFQFFNLLRALNVVVLGMISA